MFQNFTPDNKGEEKNTGHSIHALITEIVPTAHAAKINETQDSSLEEKALIILLYITLPFSVFGLFSNGAVFWFLCCRIKNTKYTVYVLNLAIADFSVLFCHITFFISLIVWKDAFFGVHFYVAFDILTFLGFNTSFFLLTAISVERCVGTFFPLCYRFKRPKHLSTILCTVLWGLSCIMVGMDYICWQKYISSGDIYPENPVIVTVLMLFLPIMVFCSFSLFIKISKIKSPARFYRTILITVILFLIFAMPHKILSLIEYMQPTLPINENIIRSFSLLNIINSSLNPFVYFFVGRQKRCHSKEPLQVVIYRSCNDESLGHASSETVTHSH